MRNTRCHLRKRMILTDDIERKKISQRSYSDKKKYEVVPVFFFSSELVDVNFLRRRSDR